MKLWRFLTAAPRRRASTKLTTAYETRRVRELREAFEAFASGTAGTPR